MSLMTFAPTIRLASPETLACLEDALVKSHYDLRQVLRLILNSRTYLQSSLPNNDTTDPAVAFAHYTVRRQDAEVLIDALCWIGGDGESYVSETPEPFTFIPTTLPHHRPRGREHHQFFPDYLRASGPRHRCHVRA